MTDTRTRREKLRDMASQTVSPAEAEVAARLLAAMPAPKTLSREDILGMPDLRADVRARRFWSPTLRVHVVIDEDDPGYLDRVLDGDA